MYRIGQEEIDAVARVIRSQKLFKTMGEETKCFERELREKIGVNYTILMTSGKAAIISALVALGVGPGDEVIVPAYTYIATAVAVTAVGAIPVIAEVNETLTLDPADIENKISKYTKAIIPVHMVGMPCNMDALMRVAKKHNLFIVEDACQAVGGTYKGKSLGAFGDLGAFSFNHFKNITAGEGGAVLTSDRRYFERALIYHDSSAIAYFGDQLHGISEPQFCGTEFRISEITSAIMREQLKRLDGILADCRKNKKVVMDALKNDYKFVKSNDPSGDCGTVLAFWFENEAKARKFSKFEGINGLLPIDTGKHVYREWTPIIEKRGAFNPAMDPFKMEANRNLNFNCTPDACPNTLGVLSRAVYIWVNPDWSEQKIEKLIAACKSAR